ncbi:tyrosine-type recombinase/integrase [Hymenobacter monticola]|uniref:Site-specific integrase n=1 Tax=Hymenobacter monticola TaxID=1705399 RepID=A0ABY4AZ72_9BACT|nr:tyrosine-type recombinase/integrase [Hymenobacter monticola]UOE32213.1 site-specific integrase [Hymenobacter monticola]
MKTKTTAASLQLRNPNGKLSTLTVEYRDPESKFKRISTGVKVVNTKSAKGEYMYFDGETIKANGSPDPKTDTQTARELLADTNAVIDALERKLKRWPLVSELTAALATQAAPKPDTLTVVAAIENYMQHEGHDWAPSTIKSHRTLINCIKHYEATNNKELIAASITVEDVKAFQVWLRETQDYENSTLGRRVTILKKVLRHVGMSQPLALNTDQIKPLHTLAEKKPFTLSFADIKAILALDLPTGGYLERTRDLLILQTMTGLRWSDIERLQASHITSQGVLIAATKTTKYVAAPLLEPGRGVINKYTTETGSLELPRRSNQKQNKYLKELAQMVPSLDRPVTVIIDKGARTKEETVQAWEAVSTHTARRSLITCALDLGLPIHVVKSWSGHSSMSAFLRYVNPHNILQESADKFNTAFLAKIS